MCPWIRELGRLQAEHRHALQLHLLALDADDRCQRFGMTLNDARLLAWAQSIDWSNERWWGAWAVADAGLLGALQLSPTRQPTVWELALSVSPLACQQGVANHLLQLASQHARDLGAQQLLTLHGHPAVARMAQSLGYRTRLRPHGARLEIDLLLN